MDNSNRLLEQAKQEKVLFTEILALSERQLLLFRNETKLEEDIVEDFNALIDKRQTLIDSIENLRAASIIDQEVIKEENLRIYQGLRQEIENTILNIQSNDQEISVLAEKVLNGFGEQLRTTRNRKRAYEAYMGEDEPAGKGWFIDSKK